MLSISRNNSLLFFIFVTVIGFTIIYIFLPVGVGSYWSGHMLSNIYLPNFGLDSSAASVNGQSLISYLSLVKIISLFTNDPLSTIHTMVFVNIFCVLFSYILLIRLFPGNEKMKKWVAFGFPLIIIIGQNSVFTGYVLAPSIMLSFIIIFQAIYSYNHTARNLAPFFVIAIISWITLGLMWHSWQVATYFITILILLEPTIHKVRGNVRGNLNINLILLFTVVLITIWIYMRKDLIAGIFYNPNLEFNIFTIFGKGSFTNQYSYQYSSFSSYVDTIRYISYVLLYILMITIAFKYIFYLTKKEVYYLIPKERSLIYMLITIFLIADGAFQLLYYISTKSMGPGIALFLSFPIMIIFLNNKPLIGENLISRYHINKIITACLVIPILFTSFTTFYSYIRVDPDHSIEYHRYQNSFVWITDNSKAKIVLSDSATSANYQMIYCSDNIYKIKSINITSVDYNTYDNIARGSYYNQGDTLFILNKALYDHHLIFGSLESWNRFEPISPYSISENTNLNHIYNDSNVIIIY